jgi:microcystin-dependent protein
MALYTWSQTAASNSNADGTINWAEGQAPSTVNDSARAMMAAVAKYRDDISGAIVTSGTSTAYTVTSNSSFDTLAHLNGQLIAFTPHTTNGATVTLNVDGLGAKPLRISPSVEIQSGTIIQGTPYIAIYNNSDGAFYLHGASNQAYAIPLGSSIEYWGTSAPNSAFAFPYGQAVSRTTYATLFSLFSTTYGSGDGSTTFNLPDCRGRVVIGKDDMGGSAAGRVTSAAGITGTTLGSAGGNQSITIAQNQLPNVAPTFTGSASGQSFVQNTSNVTFIDGSASSGQAFGPTPPVVATAAPSGTISSINGGVTQQGTVIMPPGIIANRILRII